MRKLNKTIAGLSFYGWCIVSWIRKINCAKPRLLLTSKELNLPRKSGSDAGNSEPIQLTRTETSEKFKEKLAKMIACFPIKECITFLCAIIIAKKYGLYNFHTLFIKSIFHIWDVYFAAKKNMIFLCNYSSEMAFASFRHSGNYNVVATQCTKEIEVCLCWVLKHILSIEASPPCSEPPWLEGMGSGSLKLHAMGGVANRSQARRS